jgi:hypothetical protein
MRYILRKQDIMSWMNEIDSKIAEQIREAGNRVIVVPAQSISAPIDTYDVYNGATKTFIATDVSEQTANEFASMWNGLIDQGEQVDTIRKINIEYLTGVKAGKTY